MFIHLKEQFIYRIRPTKILLYDFFRPHKCMLAQSFNKFIHQTFFNIQTKFEKFAIINMIPNKASVKFL